MAHNGLDAKGKAEAYVAATAGTNEIRFAPYQTESLVCFRVVFSRFPTCLLQAADTAIKR